MSTATHDTNHTSEMLGNLLSFLKNKPNLKALLTCYAAEVQAAEDMLWSMLTQRYALTGPPAGQTIAFGQQLDGIGDIVVQPRGGLGDAAYILQLSAKIAVNTCSGLINEILSIIGGYLQGANPYGLIPSWPAQFVVTFTGPMSTANVSAMISLIGSTKGAGIGGLVVYQGPSTADNQTFKLDSGSVGLDQGKLKAGTWS